MLWKIDTSRLESPCSASYRIRLSPGASWRKVLSTSTYRSASVIKHDGGFPVDCCCIPLGPIPTVQMHQYLKPLFHCFPHWRNDRYTSRVTPFGAPSSLLANKKPSLHIAKKLLVGSATFLIAIRFHFSWLDCHGRGHVRQARAKYVILVIQFAGTIPVQHHTICISYIDPVPMVAYYHPRVGRAPFEIEGLCHKCGDCIGGIT